MLAYGAMVTIVAVLVVMNYGIWIMIWKDIAD